MIITPMDGLNFMKGKEVEIMLKNGSIIVGKLAAFDLNTNLSVEKNGRLEFIQGESVHSVGMKEGTILEVKPREEEKDLEYA